MTAVLGGKLKRRLGRSVEEELPFGVLEVSRRQNHDVIVSGDVVVENVIVLAVEECETWRGSTDKGTDKRVTCQDSNSYQETEANQNEDEQAHEPFT